MNQKVLWKEYVLSSYLLIFRQLEQYLVLNKICHHGVYRGVIVVIGILCKLQVNILFYYSIKLLHYYYKMEMMFFKWNPLILNINKYL